MDREEIYEMVFQEMMETAVRERNEHSKSVISSESAMLSDFISRRGMAKLIFTSRYIRNAPPEHLQNYVRYISTREGVEKVDESKKNLPVTSAQKNLLRQLLKDMPESKDMLEYEDYRKHPTIGNASEFITQALERNLDMAAMKENYVDYLANRPPRGADVKHLVDQIVDELAKDPTVAKAYQAWGEWQTQILMTYSPKAPPLPPLSGQKQLKSIKNMVIAIFV